MSHGPVKPEEVPDAEARLPPPPPADPLARGVSEVLVRDPRPARPPAREGAPHPALRAASHPGRPDQRRSAGEPRRGGALRRRGRALVGEPRRPRAGARDPGSAAGRPRAPRGRAALHRPDRKSTRLNSSHLVISYAVFCLKKKKSHSWHKKRTKSQTPSNVSR